MTACAEVFCLVVGLRLLLGDWGRFAPQTPRGYFQTENDCQQPLQFSVPKYPGEFEGQRPSFSTANHTRNLSHKPNDLPRQRRNCFTGGQK
jgi:hypothetical protein